MFGFYRKWKQSRATTSQSAASKADSQNTNPDVLARQILNQARQYAVDNDIPLGKEFWFNVELNLPGGVSGTYKVSRSLMSQAFEYGLSSSAVLSSRVAFIRLV